MFIRTYVYVVLTIVKVIDAWFALEENFELENVYFKWLEESLFVILLSIVNEKCHILNDIKII